MIQNQILENQEVYILHRNRANKIIRREKRESEKKFIKSIEEYRTNPRIFFRNSIKEGFKPSIMIMKDKIGNLLTDDACIINIFREHFNSFLNIFLERCDTVEIDCPRYYTVQPEILEHNIEEIQYLIKILKNNRALEVDNINSQLIKMSNIEIVTKI